MRSLKWLAAILLGINLGFWLFLVTTDDSSTESQVEGRLPRVASLELVATEPEPEPEPEHLGQVTDPAANDEESDSARWRAERRYQNAAERDELDLY